VEESVEGNKKKKRWSIPWRVRDGRRAARGLSRWVKQRFQVESRYGDDDVAG